LTIRSRPSRRCIPILLRDQSVICQSLRSPRTTTSTQGEPTFGRLAPIPKLLLGHLELVIRMPKHPLGPPRRVQKPLRRAMTPVGRVRSREFAVELSTTRTHVRRGPQHEKVKRRTEADLEIGRSDENDLGPKRPKDHLREDGQRGSVQVFDTMVITARPASVSFVASHGLITQTHISSPVIASNPSNR
jgi:hypothetical protein